MDRHIYVRILILPPENNSLDPLSLQFNRRLRGKPVGMTTQRRGSDVEIKRIGVLSHRRLRRSDLLNFPSITDRNRDPPRTSEFTPRSNFAAPRNRFASSRVDICPLCMPRSTRPPATYRPLCDIIINTIPTLSVYDWHVQWLCRGDRVY